MNIEATNPYAAPQTITAAPLQIDGTPQPVNIFSISGRIGRVRYLGYSIGLTFLIMIVGSLLGLVTFGIGIILAYIAVMVIQVMLTIQRCHDFNTSGWLAILWIIPLVNLIFIFIPGTKGANNYGNQTPPNNTLGIVLVCILPAVFVIGMLAAIAIPAYSDYTKRAAASQNK